MLCFLVLPQQTTPMELTTTPIPTPMPTKSPTFFFLASLGLGIVVGIGGRVSISMGFIWLSICKLELNDHGFRVWSSNKLVAAEKPMITHSSPMNFGKCHIPLPQKNVELNSTIRHHPRDQDHQLAEFSLKLGDLGLPGECQPIFMIQYW